MSRALVLMLLLAWPAAPVLAQRDIRADSLVAPELLAGPGWEVEPRVDVRGYQARFVIRTDWGDVHADSVEMLALRVAEMPAVRALHDQRVLAALKQSGGEVFLQPVSALGSIARRPLDTVTGMPRGVARYFGERWDRLRDASRKLADRGRKAITNDGDPYAHNAGPIASAGDTVDAREPGWWSRRGRDVARLIRKEAGFPEARRQLALQLGIDPHTDNELIVPRLDGLAWAQASGKLASDEALTWLAGPAAAVLSHAVTLDRLVLQSPEPQRQQQLLADLAPHCRDTALLRAFIGHQAFSPTLQDELSRLYRLLAPAQGCEALLETALMAQDDMQARFVINGLRLLAHYFGEQSRGGRIVPQGALLAYESASGEFVLPLAVDWLSWTRQLRRWFDLPVISRKPQRTLLLSGSLSPRAQRELTERGWSIVPRLPYPGAPPYRRALSFTYAD